MIIHILSTLPSPQSHHTFIDIARNNDSANSVVEDLVRLIGLCDGGFPYLWICHRLLCFVFRPKSKRYDVE
ncbi:hypothetical protein M8C21_005887 [Ambrosia artemisiifolia]|uniref:Uncharacterized protein n=1 Tax=Ambrosia artemisiifolia TaxID=4212 RepID=A0AAD5GCQ9_AMBAR|nr:hypothetical protein M8C21_005887 [Ambrosia artemisiifolia]